MAITEKIIDGELHLVVETAEDFARALDRDLPIDAPAELAARFGIAGEEDVGTLDDITPDSAEASAYLLPGDAA